MAGACGPLVIELVLMGGRVVGLLEVVDVRGRVAGVAVDLVVGGDS